jgi:hypothetical protein
MRALAGPFSGKILLTPASATNPVAGATLGGIAWIRFPDPGQLTPGDLVTLAHELAHLAIDGRSQGPAPDSLREGMANLLALEILSQESEPAPLRSLRGMLQQGLLGTSFHAPGGGRISHQSDAHVTLEDLSAYALQPAALWTFSRRLGASFFWRLYGQFLDQQAASHRGPDVPGLLAFLERELKEDRHRDALTLLEIDLTTASTYPRRQELAWELYGH